MAAYSHIFNQRLYIWDHCLWLHRKRAKIDVALNSLYTAQDIIRSDPHSSRASSKHLRPVHPPEMYRQTEGWSMLASSNGVISPQMTSPKKFKTGASNLLQKCWNSFYCRSESGRNLVSVAIFNLKFGYWLEFDSESDVEIELGLQHWRQGQSSTEVDVSSDMNPNQIIIIIMYQILDLSSKWKQWMSEDSIHCPNEQGWGTAFTFPF